MHTPRPLAMIALVACLSGPLLAQTPMSGEEFEAYVTGRTLTFGQDGTVYGIEEFRTGRRTTWAFVGDECREGRWFEQDDEICFVYDDFPSELHCWLFWQGEQGLRARFMGEGSTTELYEVQRTAEPLICRGPDVGA